MVTNGPIAELGRSLRSLQTVAFLFLRRGDEVTIYSSFREFLLWPDLEVSAPQGGGGELSDYEKLRVARMEANTEFLRGLGLA